MRSFLQPDPIACCFVLHLSWQCCERGEPGAAALERAERTGADDQATPAAEMTGFAASPPGSARVAVAVDTGAAVATDAVAPQIVAVKPQSKPGDEQAEDEAAPTAAGGGVSKLRSFGARFKARMTHALLILGCIVFLKATTVFFQVSQSAESRVTHRVHSLCSLLWSVMLGQAVYCVPVQKRAFVPSPTAPGSGEAETELRLAVDMLTVCYQGIHGTSV